MTYRDYPPGYDSYEDYVYDNYVPDPPECDGDGMVHICHGDVRSMNGPHFYCEEYECPGCPACEIEDE